MKLEKGYLYHIYNRGNNKRRIFFSRGNYFFFKEKLRRHILPFADIIAWCLMPNHFHLMVYIKEESVEMEKHLKHPKEYYQCSVNDSIGILLRSYTRAINKQEGFSGSLFQNETKAKCLNCNNETSINFFHIVEGTIINLQNAEKQYPQVCFDYIHENPVEAGLVSKIEDWEFSSAREYFDNKSKTLVCKKRAKEFVDY